MTNARETLSRYIHVGWDQERRIVEAMKEYTRSVIDSILENPSLIYVDRSDSGRCDDEAVYNYEKFSDLKKNLV